MKIIVVCTILLSWHLLPAQQKVSNLKTWHHPGAPPGFNIEKHPTVSQMGHFVKPIRINSSSYSATLYTFNDIAIFSYFDSTSFTVTTPAGKTIADTMLDVDSFDAISPGNGIYVVSGSKPFGLLAGDAITSFASGYFAIDENGNGTSTKLNTWMMKSPPDFDPHFILFGYDGLTQFKLKDISTGNLLYEGIIDTTGYFDFPDVSSIEGKAIQVTSDKPVSALSYTDQGYYVPSANGTFAGNLFYGFSGYIAGLENSITLTSYTDNNVVVVTSLTNGDTLLVDTLNHWQVTTLGVFNDTFWKVSSSGTLTAADIPFAGWTEGYYNLTQCADSTGKEIGNEFILPTIAGDMSIFSYADNNTVHVTQLGDTSSYPYQSPVQVKDTVLQNGGVLVLSTPSGNNVFRVQSDNGVSVVQSFGGGGAGFMPINNPVSLPDLAIAQSDISFLPFDTTYQTGQNISVSLTIHNYGTAAASNVAVVAYDGNPDLGFATQLLSQNIVSISAEGDATLSFPMIIPPGARYHSIFVKVDPNNLIVELNKSNNETSKPLIQNNYLLLPLAIYFASPGALKLQGGVLSPNPFTVTANIFNTKNINFQSVEIQATSNNAMKILAGVTDTTISSFPGGGALNLSWSLQADKDSSGFCLLSLSVLIPDVDTENVSIGILVPDTIAPPVPRGLNVQTDSAGPGQVMLAWAPDSTTSDLAGYKIYYSTDSTNLLAGTGSSQGPSPIFVPNIDTTVVTGLANGADYWFALSSYDFSMNESSLTQPVKIFIVTKVRQQEPQPKTFALFQNFPNPFNPTTVIYYQLPSISHVTLKVYNVLGEEVATLVDETKGPGEYNIRFDASKLSSGVYFYQIVADNFVSTKKMVVIK